MDNHIQPHILILGSNFAGLTAARFIRKEVGEHARITVIDRKSYLLFIPNIPMTVFEDRNPALSLHMPVIDTLAHHDIDFIQAEVKDIDLDKKQVAYLPNERPGAAVESADYDYLVLALGSQLAYDQIPGFGEHGFTVSDTYYANRMRAYLNDGGYKGGPIVIGSARFHQGTRGKPPWLPMTAAACEGPVLEVGLSMATWLKDHSLGGPDKITFFTPGEMIAEDAGETIVHEFLDLAGKMGFHYLNNVEDIARIRAGGVEFANGDSREAEMTIVMPDWVPLDLLKSLPITDEPGFIVTDGQMRVPDYPEVFAVGDCAALTVPKLGGLGHMQADLVSKQIAFDLGLIPEEEATAVFSPEIVCFGDMGDQKGFYIHSTEWFGGDTSVFKMGASFYAMKMAFKELYFRTGGAPPTWGIPLTEALADNAPLP